MLHFNKFFFKKVLSLVCIIKLLLFITVSLCQKTVAVGQKCQEPVAELIQIEEASSKISDLLDVVLSYIDKVLASSDCNAADNSHIGRMLLDLMHSVPHVSPERFEEMFNSNVKVIIYSYFINHRF